MSVRLKYDRGLLTYTSLTNTLTAGPEAQSQAHLHGPQVLGSAAKSFQRPGFLIRDGR